jgi:hypothetical protein
MHIVNFAILYAIEKKMFLLCVPFPTSSGSFKKFQMFYMSVAFAFLYYVSKCRFMKFT